MAIIDCGAVDLTQSNTIGVDLSKPLGSAKPCEVKISNESPLTLLVDIAGQQHKIPAWTVDRFDLCGKTRFSINTSQVQSPSPSGVPSNLALITASTEGDSIPGIYPAPLTRMANVQSPQTFLGTLTVPLGGNNSATFVVPASTHAIGILIESGAALSQIRCTGVPSGAVYLLLPPAAASAKLQGFVISEQLSAFDTAVSIFAASGGGATLAIIAISEPSAVFAFNNPTEPLNVSLLGAATNPLGDTTAASLAADQGVESIVATGGLQVVDAALASLKPAAGQTVAQVGALGAPIVGGNTSVSPTFGQATVAGHCLVCWVTSVDGGGGGPTTAAAGWAKIKDVATTGASHAAIWARLNCGAGEAPPVFTCGASTRPMTAQLGEFSGVATAAATDQTGGASAGPAGVSTFTITVTNALADAAPGDLVLMCVTWEYSGGLSQTATFADSFNNGMVTVHAGDTGTNSQRITSSFSYAIVPSFTAPFPFGTVPWDWDATGENGPAAGSQAKVILAAVAGRAYRVHTIAASQLTTGAVAPQSAIQVIDGGATVVWPRYLGSMSATAAIGVSAGFELTGMALKITAGNTLTIQHSAAQASVEQAVAIGAYLR